MYMRIYIRYIMIHFIYSYIFVDKYLLLKKCFVILITISVHFYMINLCVVIVKLVYI